MVKQTVPSEGRSAEDVGAWSSCLGLGWWDGKQLDRCQTIYIVSTCFNMIWLRHVGRLDIDHVFDWFFSFKTKRELWLTTGGGHQKWLLAYTVALWGDVLLRRTFCGKWQRRHADFSGINMGASEHSLEGDVVHTSSIVWCIFVWPFHVRLRYQALFFDASGFERRTEAVSCHKDLYI